MTIFEILKIAKINNLDASLIVAHVLKTTRAYLIAHSDQKLTTKQASEVKKLYKKRRQHYPLAYLIHSKEFYGRKFYVNRHVLIPRPETEQIIDLALKLKGVKTVLDIGTGSGNIAITLAIESPEWSITATDISQESLAVAQKNWRQLKTQDSHNIRFIHSNLFQKLPKNQTFDLIIANLPYVNKKWPWKSEGLKYEPKKALYANENGLKLIKGLVMDSPRYLNKNSYLLIEADTSQLDTISEFTAKYLFQEVSRTGFSLLLQRKI